MFLYTFLLSVVLLVHTELIEARKLIVEGSDADISEYPHQILMHLNGEQGCGGSIYKPNIIITAAHCFEYNKDPADFTISAGYTLLSEMQVSAKVKKIIIHDKYNKNARFDNDIAIVVLDRNLEYNSKVQPIRLHQQRPPSGAPVTVIGWGRTKFNGSVSNHLQQVELNLVSNEQCKKDYSVKKWEITQRMLCAGVESGGKSPCHYDSGGPLIFEEKLIGVVSFGYKCGLKGFPAIFASIPDLYDWILKAVKNNAGSSV